MEQDKLEELEQELYGREERAEEDIRRRQTRGIFPREPEEQVRESWNEGGRKGKRTPLRGLLKLLIWAGSMFLIAGATVVFLIFFGGRGREIEIRMEGKEHVETGELVIVPVIYKNVGRVSLREIELTLLLPERAILNEAGSERPAPSRVVRIKDVLEPGQEEHVEVALRFFGKEGEGYAVSASLLYRPENLKARFSTNISRIFTIQSVPLALSFGAPEIISRGQEVEINVRYFSHARIPSENLSLRLEYPAGFIEIAVDPAPIEKPSRWHVGVLDPNEEGVVTVRGTLTGEENEIKTFRAGLGIYNAQTREWIIYNESSFDIRIATAPLSIQGFLSASRQGSIESGSPLSFSLRYRNNTSVSLKNVTIRAFIEERFFPPPGGPDGVLNPQQRFVDMASLVINDGGVLDASSREIIWGPGSIAKLRELEPSEEGEVSFGIATRGRPAIKNAQEKNLAVLLRSSINVAEIPQGFAGVKVGSEDMVIFKVRSQLLFSGRAAYRSSPIANSGPFPPKVGQKTTYAFLWEVRNFTSDLQNVEVRTSLPPNVHWEEVISPRDARIAFNEASGEIRWTIGEIRAGTGVLLPALIGAAQVSITPSEIDVRKIMTLSGESRLTALDSFTGDAVEAVVEGFSTELKGEPGATQNDWQVVR